MPRWLQDVYNAEHTTYKCLSVNAPVCNKSETCSLFAPETADGWKAGSRVAYCVECSKTSSEHKQSCSASNVDLDHAKRTSFSHNKKTAAKPATGTKTKGRRCLNLSQRVELIAFHKKNPSFGVRKLAESRVWLWKISSVRNIEVKGPILY